MNLPDFSIKRPVTTMTAIACLVVLGAVSLTRLSLDMFPEMSFPHLWVRVPYPASSPEEVERLITIPLEDALGTVNHLKSLSSSSSQDGANVSAEFEWGTNMDAAALEVREMIDKARSDLPDDIDNIYLHRFQSTDRPIIQCNVSMPGERERLFDFVEKVIKPRLERIKGVANVDVRGLAGKEVQVRLKEDLLKTFNISPYSVAYDMQTGNFDLSVGKIFYGGRRYAVRALGELGSHIEVMQLPAKGGDIRVEDFSEVVFDYPKEEYFQRVDHERAVSVQIYKASMANVVDVSRKVHRVLEELRTDPRNKDLTLLVYRDQAEEILKSIADLRQAGIIGSLLAVAVIFFFLRKFRSTLIIAIAIPVSVICTFILMYFFGISLNIISITGLALAAGMLVDNSVVVLESIYTERQKGVPAREAALNGSERVALAITAATMTTIIVFVPLIFLAKSRMGLFMKDFGMTISTALVASLFIALTLIPLLSEKMLKSPPRERTRFVLFLERHYMRIISWTLSHRVITLLIVAALFGGSVYLATGIKREYFPQVADRAAYFTMQVPNSYSIEKTVALIDEFERKLTSMKEELEIENFTTYFRRREGWFNVFFKEADERKGDVIELSRKVKSLFPSAPGVQFEMAQRRGRHGGEMGITVEVTGRDAETLLLVAEKVKSALSEVPGLEDITTDLESGVEEARVVVKREQAAKYGLSPMTVARTLASAYGSRPVTRLEIAGNQVEVIVQYQENDRKDLSRLDDLYILNSDGGAVPLGAVSEVKIVEGPVRISRENRRRIVQITSNTDVRGMATLGGIVQQKLSAIEFPKGYNWRFGEEFRTFQESERESGFAIIIAVVLIYMLMASLFESLLHPFTIMCSIPFAFIGVAIVFRLTGTTLNNISILGLMILCGIVVNNAIVLLHHVNQLRQAGMERREALITGGRDRLRPILMAALTTILGLIPLAFLRGEGQGALWAPMGKAVIGGLTASTFLTLILIPTFYSVFDDASVRLKGFGRIVRDGIR